MTPDELHDRLSTLADPACKAFGDSLQPGVTDRLGVELVLQPISWDSKELELSGKNIDCIWSGLTMTPERIEQMTFALTSARPVSSASAAAKQRVRTAASRAAPSIQ